MWFWTSLSSASMLKNSNSRLSDGKRSSEVLYKIVTDNCNRTSTPSDVILPRARYNAILYNKVRLSPIGPWREICQWRRVHRSLYSHAGSAFALNHALNRCEIAREGAHSRSDWKIYVPHAFGRHPCIGTSRNARECIPHTRDSARCEMHGVFIRAMTHMYVPFAVPRAAVLRATDDERRWVAYTHAERMQLHATGNVTINRPWRWRGSWSSSARRRRESTGSILIVRCAGGRCASSSACAAPRRSSGRSTASVMPRNRPASGSTRTPSTSLKQMASVCHRLSTTTPLRTSTASSGLPPGVGLPGDGSIA